MATSKLLVELPDYRDACGCSLDDGRCAAHAAMMTDIHQAWQSGDTDTMLRVWSLSDGYGVAGFIPEQGYDWSGIRDSSTAAIEAMWDETRRAYCATCGTELLYVATYGAPGKGEAWECDNGHEWAKLGGQFVDPSTGAHIMEPWEVV
jgi:hypothetical protein